jgi:hypothetical protein
MTTISNLDVINAAATRTGNQPVTAISSDDGSVAQIALSNYEDSVKTELALYPWKRASKIIQIDRIDADVQGDPPEPWTAAYQLPDDLIEIRTVKVAGYPIDYEVHGDKILCDAGETDEVILHYIWRVPEADWPPWFREGMIRRWEAILLRGVGERAREAQARDEAADESFAKARNRDSQSQTPRDPMRSPTLEARGGSQWPRPESPRWR